MTSSIARLIALDSVNSTSSYLAGIAETMPHGTVVSAYAQTAGRGQRGNSWESEPGANLTFSMLLRPDGIRAAEQFSLSEAVALGLASALRHYLPDTAVCINGPTTYMPPTARYAVFLSRILCSVAVYVIV